LHAHPEIGLEEERTSAVVARELERLGYRVTRGLAKTGVVGTLKLGSGRRSIGIRADIDALPIHETTGLPYASRTPGKMHACGHDGHTTMLLGAARLLAERKNFDGTVHLIFQPAEENVGGAGMMVDEGLFKKFPCDEIFAAHNDPSMAIGSFAFRAGPIMAAVDQFQITITGKGGHSAQPDTTIDPIVAGASLLMGLQTVVSRNVDPLHAAVVTVGVLKAGDVCNVIPETAFMDGTIRYFDDAVGAILKGRIEALARGQSESFGASATVTWMNGYPVTANDPASTAFARSVGEALAPGAVSEARMTLGSEDFSFMLGKCRGSYLLIGNGPTKQLHNPGYDFSDAAIPFGAGYWTALTEQALVAA
jgi:hippurate hydrolase